jgi:hypothetical protein
MSVSETLHRKEIIVKPWNQLKQSPVVKVLAFLAASAVAITLFVVAGSHAKAAETVRWHQVLVEEAKSRAREASREGILRVDGTTSGAYGHQGESIIVDARGKANNFLPYIPTTHPDYHVAVTLKSGDEIILRYFEGYDKDGDERCKETHMHLVYMGRR